ncbi:hypothetical protein OMR72_004603 [Vibrio parahaemolyticus]|uniref:hypothetical protein n=1 Tax=Vibrio parahaemolyticus TaxID=670 RepID=UPI0015DF26DB|nr:hypothetical protein [Vibrio parahaemolyticus]EJG1014297.1 hypothetical protein [Vibrio parahaemolyticus]EKA8936288.1 hypothetical protein [Vibrio parahaemolyticus]EKF6611946.1 hypothetical protein [Vibrio parahaemolyticus]MDF4907396.1 hypothetical protein [Vibrio parahaemolyticus]HCE5105710.1 hypothetical protein [Vibrio parahaemolyticus]
MFSSNTSMPTDNIYKFLSLFGLVLTIFGGHLFNSTHNSFNDNLMNYSIDLSKLELIENPNSHEKRQIQMLEKKIELLLADKPFYMGFSSFFTALGLILMGFGFFRWAFYLQPKLDELLELQVEKAKIEVKQAKRLKFQRK